MIVFDLDEAVGSEQSWTYCLEGDGSFSYQKVCYDDTYQW